MEAVCLDDCSQTSSPTNLDLTICFYHVYTSQLCWRSRGLPYQILLASLFLVFCMASGLDLVSENSSHYFFWGGVFPDHVEHPSTCLFYPDVSLIPSLLAQLSSYTGEHG